MNYYLQVLIGALVLGATYGMLSLGYSLIYQASGFMNFTQPDLLMFGAFIMLTTYANLKWPYVIALLFSVAVMFFIGQLMERGIIRVLIKKKAKNIYVVLATIGLSIIMQNLAMLIWDSRTHSMPSVFNDSEIIILGVRAPSDSILAIFIAILSMLGLHFFMNKTKFGTSMRAAAQNKMAASAMGINVWKTISITYGIAAGLACVGGVIIAPRLGINFTLGANLGIKGFAGAVIGGYGNIYGAIVGAAVLAIVETFTSAYISSVYKDFISFFILIIVLVIKPTGIFNAKIYDQ